MAAASCHDRRDLALVGNAVQLPGLFDIPTDDKHIRLSGEQIQRYSKDGFLANVPCLSEAQVKQLRDVELPLLMNSSSSVYGSGNPLWYEYNANESDDGKHVLFHSLGAWRLSCGFHDLVFLRSIVLRVQQLLTLHQEEIDGIQNYNIDTINGSQGVGVRFWHDQLFCKPAKNGSCVAWHQDYSYWTRTIPMNHITVHIALDDQTVENGALHYVPGSHRWPLLPITSRHFGDMDSIQDLLDDEQKAAFKPVPVLLKAGEISFHHALTVHGSYGNQSDGPRRAAVLNYFADGTVAANDNDELLRGVPTVSKGKKLNGVFFPLVAGPDL